MTARVFPADKFHPLVAMEPQWSLDYIQLTVNAMELHILIL
jgi:hypothetical protein